MNDQRSFSLTELAEVLSGSDELIHSFLKLHDCEYNFSQDSEQIHVKELKSYGPLLKHILNLDIDSRKLDGFFLGLKLKDQADTQFDLIKPSNDTIINIEFKAAIPHNSIDKQAKEHFRFLRFKYSNPLVYEYIADSDELFVFDRHSEKLEPFSFSNLENVIPNESTGISQLESMRRADFLIAPYNETKKFLKKQYELTDNQKQIRQKILSEETGAFAIEGGPGCGKTLLLLDIITSVQARNKSKDRDISIAMMMGAKPGEGQKQLAAALEIELSWYYGYDDLSSFTNFNVLVFDESQRIPRKLIEDAIAQSTKKLVIFNVDKKQVVHPEEKRADIQGLLETSKQVQVEKLKKSIRINPSLNHFQKRLFDKHAKNAQILDFRDVSASYFNDSEAMCTYLNDRRKEQVVIIEPDTYVTNQTGSVRRPHHYPYSVDVKSVIGQEFDNVILVFDSHLKYVNEKLQYVSEDWYPYMDLSMFYQAITRASGSVEIIVFQNETLYRDIQALLTATRDNSKKDKDQIDLLRKQLSELKVELQTANEKLAARN